MAPLSSYYQQTGVDFAMSNSRHCSTSTEYLWSLSSSIAHTSLNHFIKRNCGESDGKSSPVITNVKGCQITSTISLQSPNLSKRSRPRAITANSSSLHDVSPAMTEVLPTDAVGIPFTPSGETIASFPNSLNPPYIFPQRTSVFRCVEPRGYSGNAVERVSTLLNSRIMQIEALCSQTQPCSPSLPIILGVMRALSIAIPYVHDVSRLTCVCAALGHIPVTATYVPTFVLSSSSLNVPTSISTASTSSSFLPHHPLCVPLVSLCHTHVPQLLSSAIEHQHTAQLLHADESSATCRFDNPVRFLVFSPLKTWERYGCEVRDAHRARKDCWYKLEQNILTKIAYGKLPPGFPLGEDVDISIYHTHAQEEATSLISPIGLAESPIELAESPMNRLESQALASTEPIPVTVTPSLMPAATSTITSNTRVYLPATTPSMLVSPASIAMTRSSATAPTSPASILSAISPVSAAAAISSASSVPQSLSATPRIRQTHGAEPLFTYNRTETIGMGEVGEMIDVPLSRRLKRAREEDSYDIETFQEDVVPKSLHLPMSQPSSPFSKSGRKSDERYPPFPLATSRSKRKGHKELRFCPVAMWPVVEVADRHLRMTVFRELLAKTDSESNEKKAEEKEGAVGRGNKHEGLYTEAGEDIGDKTAGRGRGSRGEGGVQASDRDGSRVTHTEPLCGAVGDDGYDGYESAGNAAGGTHRVTPLSQSAKGGQLGHPAVLPQESQEEDPLQLEQTGQDGESRELGETGLPRVYIGEDGPYCLWRAPRKRRRVGLSSTEATNTSLEDVDAWSGDALIPLRPPSSSSSSSSSASSSSSTSSSSSSSCSTASAWSLATVLAPLTTAQSALHPQFASTPQCALTIACPRTLTSTDIYTSTTNTSADGTAATIATTSTLARLPSTHTSTTASADAMTDVTEEDADLPFRSSGECVLPPRRPDTSYYIYYKYHVLPAISGCISLRPPFRIPFAECLLSQTHGNGQHASSCSSSSSSDMAQARIHYKSKLLHYYTLRYPAAEASLRLEQNTSEYTSTGDKYSGKGKSGKMNSGEIIANNDDIDTSVTSSSFFSPSSPPLHASPTSTSTSTAHPRLSSPPSTAASSPSSFSSPSFTSASFADPHRALSLFTQYTNSLNNQLDCAIFHGCSADLDITLLLLCAAMGVSEGWRAVRKEIAVVDVHMVVRGGVQVPSPHAQMHASSSFASSSASSSTSASPPALAHHLVPCDRCVYCKLPSRLSLSPRSHLSLVRCQTLSVPGSCNIGMSPIVISQACHLSAQQAHLKRILAVVPSAARRDMLRKLVTLRCVTMDQACVLFVLGDVPPQCEGGGKGACEGCEHGECDKGCTTRWKNKYEDERRRPGGRTSKITYESGSRGCMVSLCDSSTANPANAYGNDSVPTSPSAARAEGVAVDTEDTDHHHNDDPHGGDALTPTPLAFSPSSPSSPSSSAAYSSPLCDCPAPSCAAPLPVHPPTPLATLPPNAHLRILAPLLASTLFQRRVWLYQVLCVQAEAHMHDLRTPAFMTAPMLALGGFLPQAAATVYSLCMMGYRGDSVEQHRDSLEELRANEREHGVCRDGSSHTTSSSSSSFSSSSPPHASPRTLSHSPYSPYSTRSRVHTALTQLLSSIYSIRAYPCPSYSYSSSSSVSNSPHTHSSSYLPAPSPVPTSSTPASSTPPPPPAALSMAGLSPYLSPDALPHPLITLLPLLSCRLETHIRARGADLPQQYAAPEVLLGGANDAIGDAPDAVETKRGRAGDAKVFMGCVEEIEREMMRKMKQKAKTESDYVNEHDVGSDGQSWRNIVNSGNVHSEVFDSITASQDVVLHGSSMIDDIDVHDLTRQDGTNASDLLSSQNNFTVGNGTSQQNVDAYNPAIQEGASMYDVSQVNLRDYARAAQVVAVHRAVLDKRQMQIQTQAQAQALTTGGSGEEQDGNVADSNTDVIAVSTISGSMLGATGDATVIDANLARRGDIWTTGMLLWELYEGNSPFGGNQDTLVGTDMLLRLFSTLGTPTPITCPSLSSLPGWTPSLPQWQPPPNEHNQLERKLRSMKALSSQKTLSNPNQEENREITVPTIAKKMRGMSLDGDLAVSEPRASVGVACGLVSRMRVPSRAISLAFHSSPSLLPDPDMLMMMMSAQAPSTTTQSFLQSSVPSSRISPHSSADNPSSSSTSPTSPSLALVQPEDLGLLRDPPAARLALSLLQLCPGTRPNAVEALRHEYFAPVRLFIAYCEAVGGLDGGEGGMELECEDGAIHGVDANVDNDAGDDVDGEMVMKLVHKDKQKMKEGIGHDVFDNTENGVSAHELASDKDCVNRDGNANSVHAPLTGYNSSAVDTGTPTDTIIADKTRNTAPDASTDTAADTNINVAMGNAMSKHVHPSLSSLDYSSFLSASLSTESSAYPGATRSSPSQPPSLPPAAGHHFLRAWHLLRVQATLSPLPFRFHEFNCEITPLLRLKLVDWIYDVVYEFSFHSIVVYNAIAFIDRAILMFPQCTAKRMQRLGHACLAIALKATFPSSSLTGVLSTLCLNDDDPAERARTAQELEAMEVLLLSRLSLPLRQPTMFDYLCIALSACWAPPIVDALARYLTLLAQYLPNIACFPAHTVALACTVLALLGRPLHTHEPMPMSLTCLLTHIPAQHMQAWRAQFNLCIHTLFAVWSGNPIPVQPCVTEFPIFDADGLPLPALRMPGIRVSSCDVASMLQSGAQMHPFPDLCDISLAFSMALEHPDNNNTDVQHDPAHPGASFTSSSASSSSADASLQPTSTHYMGVDGVWLLPASVAPTAADKAFEDAVAQCCVRLGATTPSLRRMYRLTPAFIEQHRRRVDAAYTRALVRAALSQHRRIRMHAHAGGNTGAESAAGIGAAPRVDTAVSTGRAAAVEAKTGSDADSGAGVGAGAEKIPPSALPQPSMPLSPSSALPGIFSVAEMADDGRCPEHAFMALFMHLERDDARDGGKDYVGDGSCVCCMGVCAHATCAAAGDTYNAPTSAAAAVAAMASASNHVRDSHFSGGGVGVGVHSSDRMRDDAAEGQASTANTCDESRDDDDKKGKGGMQCRQSQPRKQMHLQVQGCSRGAEERGHKVEMEVEMAERERERWPKTQGCRERGNEEGDGKAEEGKQMHDPGTRNTISEGTSIPTASHVAPSTSSSSLPSASAKRHPSHHNHPPSPLPSLPSTSPLRTHGSSPPGAAHSACSTFFIHLEDACGNFVCSLPPTRKTALAVAAQWRSLHASTTAITDTDIDIMTTTPPHVFEDADSPSSGSTSTSTSTSSTASPSPVSYSVFPSAHNLPSPAPSPLARRWRLCVARWRKPLWPGGPLFLPPAIIAREKTTLIAEEAARVAEKKGVFEKVAVKQADNIASTAYISTPHHPNSHTAPSSPSPPATSPTTSLYPLISSPGLSLPPNPPIGLFSLLSGFETSPQTLPTAYLVPAAISLPQRASIFRLPEPILHHILSYLPLPTLLLLRTVDKRMFLLVSQHLCLVKYLNIAPYASRMPPSALFPLLVRLPSLTHASLANLHAGTATVPLLRLLLANVGKQLEVLDLTNVGCNTPYTCVKHPQTAANDAGTASNEVGWRPGRGRRDERDARNSMWRTGGEDSTHSLSNDASRHVPLLSAPGSSPNAATTTCEAEGCAYVYTSSCPLTPSSASIQRLCVLLRSILARDAVLLPLTLYIMRKRLGDALRVASLRSQGRKKQKKSRKRRVVRRTEASMTYTPVSAPGPTQSIAVTPVNTRENPSIPGKSVNSGVSSEYGADTASSASKLVDSHLTPTASSTDRLPHATGVEMGTFGGVNTGVAAGTSASMGVNMGVSASDVEGRGEWLHAGSSAANTAAHSHRPADTTTVSISPSHSPHVCGNAVEMSHIADIQPTNPCQDTSKHFHYHHQHTHHECQHAIHHTIMQTGKDIILPRSPHHMQLPPAAPMPACHGLLSFLLLGPLAKQYTRLTRARRVRGVRAGYKNRREDRYAGRHESLELETDSNTDTHININPNIITPGPTAAPLSASSSQSALHSDVIAIPQDDPACLYAAACDSVMALARSLLTPLLFPTPSLHTLILDRSSLPPSLLLSLLSRSPHLQRLSIRSTDYPTALYKHLAQLPRYAEVEAAVEEEEFEGEDTEESEEDVNDAAGMGEGLEHGEDEDVDRVSGMSGAIRTNSDAARTQRHHHLQEMSHRRHGSRSGGRSGSEQEGGGSRRRRRNVERGYAGEVRDVYVGGVRITLRPDGTTHPSTSTSTSTSSSTSSSIALSPACPPCPPPRLLASLLLLDLEEANLTEAALTALLSAAPQLQVLRLDSNITLPHRVLATIGDFCPQLRLLGLASTTLTLAGLSRISKKCKWIEHLDIDCTGVAGEEFPTIISNFTRLRHLSAADCTIPWPLLYEAALSLPQLELLCLKEHEGVEIPAQDLNQLMRCCQHLQVIDIRGHLIVNAEELDVELLRRVYILGGRA